MLTARFQIPADKVRDAREGLSQFAAQFGGRLVDAFTLDDLRSQFYEGDADGAGVMMDNQSLNDFSDDLLPIRKLVKRQ